MKQFEIAESFSLISNIFAGFGSPWALEGLDRGQAAVAIMLVEQAQSTSEIVLAALAMNGEHPEEWRRVGVPWKTIDAAKERLTKAQASATIIK